MCLRSAMQRWRIRITQIECSSISRADAGCLQYHTGVYGKVKSFNFDFNVGKQLSNQDYSICIRPERNFCSIQYTACADTSGYLFSFLLSNQFVVGRSFIQNIIIQIDSNRSRSFTLSGNSNMAVSSMVGGGSQGTPNSCVNDWLLIGCARVADRLPPSNTCEDRICGGVFNAEVSSVEKTVISE